MANLPFIFLQDIQWLNRSSICLIRSTLVNRISSKIAMAVDLLFHPRKKVMEPCHVTGMFQTYMLSTSRVLGCVMTARSQEEKEMERHS